MTSGLRNGNLLLAFVIEMAMLVAFALAGWSVSEIFWLRLTLAIALPAIAIAMWALWAAPKAKKYRLRPGPLRLFKLAIFAAATLAWVVAGQGFIAAIFGTLAAIQLLAAAAFRQN